MGDHYQCRLAKRLDGKKIVTFPPLGKMYAHGQKTLKSCHNFDQAIAVAKEFNSSLPAEVIGLVIIEYKAEGHYQIYNKPIHGPGVRHSMRRVDTTKWLRFIDRKGEVFNLNPKTHEICENA
jgi:hypothetical protein